MLQHQNLAMIQADKEEILEPIEDTSFDLSSVNILSTHVLVATAIGDRLDTFPVKQGERFYWTSVYGQWRSAPTGSWVSAGGEPETSNIGVCKIANRCALVAQTWIDTRPDGSTIYWAQWRPEVHKSPPHNGSHYYINNSPWDWELRFFCNDGPGNHDHQDNAGQLTHTVVVF